MNIAVITSGGDAPGMNPCIADLAAGAWQRGHKLFAYTGGYPGIRDNLIMPLEPCDVRGWHKLGGTKIKSGRLPELKNRDTQLQVINILRQNHIGALAVLGGDGSFRGARALGQAGPDINFIGIPCTIDNDVDGSDYSLGHDTALNKLVTYIDDITDTAMSMYPRVFLVETLGGKDSRFALAAVDMGLCDFAITHADTQTVPEICEKISALIARDMGYAMISVAEDIPGISDIIRGIQDMLNMPVRYSNIGYQQRGGIPTALERVHAAAFARMALDAAERGMMNKYVVYSSGEYGYRDLADCNYVGIDR